MAVVVEAWEGTDLNRDGDYEDAVLFTIDLRSLPAEEPFHCGDSNADGLNHLFSGADAPPAPFGECGVDPTEDELECESGGPCA